MNMFKTDQVIFQHGYKTPNRDFRRGGFRELTLPARRVGCGVIALLLLISATTAHADWRQFRGDDQRSASPDAKVPAEWGEAEITWKAELPGRAASSPVGPAPTTSTVLSEPFVAIFSGCQPRRHSSPMVGF